MSRYEAWINKLSIPKLIAVIAGLVAILGGVAVADWYLARWLPLALWVPAVMAGVLARPVWKAVRK